MPDKKAVVLERGFQTHVFSNAIVYDNMVHVSGNIGMDYPTKQMTEGPIGERTVSNHSYQLAIVLVLLTLRRRRRLKISNTCLKERVAVCKI